METLRQSLIPGRISRIYADTKRNYELMIRNNDLTTSHTATHTKLKIQKDRLIAWGLAWEDSHNAQDGDGDIDNSLDKAGISDLVASIMSSIQDLLERADAIQPQRSTSFPGPFPSEKAGLAARHHSQWSLRDLNELSDIVQDLTTSIDTLCDLSRSRHAFGQTHQTHLPSAQSPFSSERATSKERRPIEEAKDLLNMTRIDENLLQTLDDDVLPAASSSPPSYESVAAGSEDRVLAVLSTSNESVKGGLSTMPGRVVLLEYVPIIDAISTGQHQPPADRYDDLLQLEPTALAGLGPTYLGSLKLLGWVQDNRRARNALVYELPLPSTYALYDERLKPKTFTLLSFLQHGADTDSNNMPSLEDRFRLGFNLASSLLHLHAKGLLHRNINSKNVVFFSNTDNQTSGDTRPWKQGIIRHPFLTSFDQCTENVFGDLEEPFISNIYRHPLSERGLRSTFKPTYDVYSLGLILLEVGLWMPISKLWKTRYTRHNFKSRLQSVYTRKLAGKCGTKYMKVVEHCLKAGDLETVNPNTVESRPEKNDPFAASQNSLYWKAFKVLENCCSIDDTEESVPAYESAEVSTSTQAHGVGSRDPAPSEKGASVRKTEQASVESLPEIASVTQPAQDAERTDKRRSKCKVWSHDIPAAFSMHWQQCLEPKLNRMFSKIIDRWESYSIELLMAGETAEVARPTIYMVCASVEKARKVLQYVNQDGGLFDIKVSKGQILRSKAGRKKPRGKGKRKQPGKHGQDKIQEFKHYQERPTCGASIGAYLDEQHLPPVSFGGTVLVNGEPYGMSVHHMLENDDIDLGLDDSLTLKRSIAPVTMDQKSPKESAPRPWSTDAPPEALYPFEISDDEDEGYRSGVEEDDDLSEFDPSQWDIPDAVDLDDVDMGDTPGIEPGQGDALVVTQPAIDDVDEGFFPNEEDMDEDHLASHSFGHIHASSGIKRRHRGPISHEVDWALIKIREHRRGDTNLIKDGIRHCVTGNPCQVVKANELGGLKVHALGRTSGLQTGTILPSMVTVKMPGRISHSQSWQVAGKFGVGGDSGAWVIDNATGGVCAHVLAWSERNNTAYVAPMEVLFEDMAQTLQADVILPGQQRSESVNSEPLEDLGLQEKGQSTDKESLAIRQPLISRELTSSPPTATSPPPALLKTSSSGIGDTTQQTSPTGAELSRQHGGTTRCMIPGSFILDNKRKSGSEKLMEKGEEGFKANYRMSIG
ncbi:MAG: hypothetical protein Q9220_006664 [cf. Caloplaca sp. 1 TL-2023]